MIIFQTRDHATISILGIEKGDLRATWPVRRWCCRTASAPTSTPPSALGRGCRFPAGWLVPDAVPSVPLRPSSPAKDVLTMIENKQQDWTEQLHMTNVSTQLSLCRGATTITTDGDATHVSSINLSHSKKPASQVLQ